MSFRLWHSKQHWVNNVELNVRCIPAVCLAGGCRTLQFSDAIIFRTRFVIFQRAAATAVMKQYQQLLQRTAKVISVMDLAAVAGARASADGDGGRGGILLKQDL